MTGIHLPRRTPHNQAMVSALHVWHNPNQGLTERVLAGLRALDRPVGCRSTDALRGYAHAHQVMAAHAGHHCPRYRLAADYAVEVRP